MNIAKMTIFILRQSFDGDMNVNLFTYFLCQHIKLTKHFRCFLLHTLRESFRCDIFSARGSARRLFTLSKNRIFFRDLLITQHMICAEIIIKIYNNLIQTILQCHLFY